jgi:hypothetical protein
VFVTLLPEQALSVAPGAIFDVEDLGGCTFLFVGALGLVYCLLRGGLSDCVHVGKIIHSVGVAQLL